MKFIFFHLQGYRDLPRDFAENYDSIWVTPPTDELCDPELVSQYMGWNIEELEIADEVGFDGLGVNEHHQNGYALGVSPNLTAAVLAHRKSDAALVVLGNSLPLYNPPIRVAEEFAVLDCMSRGRLIAGFPVGTPMDTVGCYGVPPAEVRPRWREAHDLITQAWTRPGPFAFNGRFTKLRYVNPWPKPLQDPYPPIWLAGGGSAETWQMSTDHDYAYNYLGFAGWRSATPTIRAYWDHVERAGLDDNPYRLGFVQIVVVADTDEEAERLYLPHIQNLYANAMHIPSHLGNVAGYMSVNSMRDAIRRAMAGGPPAPKRNPFETDWNTYTNVTNQVIGGSPDTVAQQLEESIRTLRVGHLMVILQLQSMGRELTEHNIRMFGEKVMPKLRHIWTDHDYEDRWWPKGARGGASAAATAGRGAVR